MILCWSRIFNGTCLRLHEKPCRSFSIEKPQRAAVMKTLNLLSRADNGGVCHLDSGVTHLDEILPEVTSAR